METLGLEEAGLDRLIRAGYDLLGLQTGWYTTGLGAQLTWTLPFGLLIMFAVFNRFNPAYEEAARDLGATPWQTFRHVVLPLIGPSVVGIGMFGFTLSWDEIARSSQAIGDLNTLPLELQGLTSTVTTPAIYALGTVTTVVSFAVMGVAVGLALWLGWTWLDPVASLLIAAVIVGTSSYEAFSARTGTWSSLPVTQANNYSVQTSGAVFAARRSIACGGCGAAPSRATRRAPNRRRPGSIRISIVSIQDRGSAAGGFGGGR